MIVFTTTSCRRAVKIQFGGFDDNYDGRLSEYVFGGNVHGIFFSGVPTLPDRFLFRDRAREHPSLPRDYHIVIALRVPDDVLAQHAVTLNEEPFGWVLPASEANKFLDCVYGWAINFDVRYLRGVITAEELYPRTLPPLSDEQRHQAEEQLRLEDEADDEADDAVADDEDDDLVAGDEMVNDVRLAISIAEERWHALRSANEIIGAPGPWIFDKEAEDDYG